MYIKGGKHGYVKIRGGAVYKTNVHHHKHKYNSMIGEMPMDKKNISILKENLSRLKTGQQNRRKQKKHKRYIKL